MAPIWKMSKIDSESLCPFSPRKDKNVRSTRSTPWLRCSCGFRGPSPGWNGISRTGIAAATAATARYTGHAQAQGPATDGSHPDPVHSESERVHEPQSYGFQSVCWILQKRLILNWVFCGKQECNKPWNPSSRPLASSWSWNSSETCDTGARPLSRIRHKTWPTRSWKSCNRLTFLESHWYVLSLIEGSNGMEWLIMVQDIQYSREESFAVSKLDGKLTAHRKKRKALLGMALLIVSNLDLLSLEWGIHLRNVLEKRAKEQPREVKKAKTTEKSMNLAWSFFSKKKECV